MVPIRLRAKHRVPKIIKGTPYRARTGPRCCGPHCPSTRGKSVQRGGRR